jgi:hypothetical protein
MPLRQGNMNASWFATKILRFYSVHASKRLKERPRISEISSELDNRASTSHSLRRDFPRNHVSYSCTRLARELPAVLAVIVIGTRRSKYPG